MLRIWRTNSKPSILGKRMSEITRSKCSARALARASTPSLASTTPVVAEGKSCRQRAQARRRFGPDPAALFFQRLLGDGQADAGALELICAHQPVEQAENAVDVFHVE